MQIIIISKLCYAIKMHPNKKDENPRTYCLFVFLRHFAAQEEVKKNIDA